MNKYASEHKEIPGNPSTAKSSSKKLNNRQNKNPLRVLTENQWSFWVQKGYIVIKNAIPKNKLKTQLISYGNLKRKIQKTFQLGTVNPEPRCK